MATYTQERKKFHNRVRGLLAYFCERIVKFILMGKGETALELILLLLKHGSTALTKVTMNLKQSL